MADTNANIRVDVDASAALAQIKQLQRQISLFHTNMAKGGAKAAAEAQNLQRNLVNSINATGQFAANMTKIKTTTESFTNALEKNKLSLNQYFRFAGASTKTFGRMFRSEFATIDKVARERVKDLQTQYIKMGRDANGAMQAIRVRPLVLDMQNLGTQTAIAAQKQQLFNQLIRQGSTNLLNWGKNTQWAGRQLMVGFTIPLTIFGATAAREFMKLEEQAIRFKRVYGDMFTTEEETQQAIKNIRELATEFTKYGIAVEKTVDLAATVAQLGATGADLNNQVREATRLAVLGGIEQQEALDTTISLTNAFGLATEELADKIAFLNAVENQTILSIEDFNIAIPKAGAVVQQLGGDVEDLAFFLTAMREGGINASESANALKSGLASIINPTQQSIDKMREFGIDVVGIVNQNAGDLRGTVMSLASALNSLDALDRARAIEQLFGKFQFARISTLFQNITKEGSQANKTLEIASYNARELGIIAERELGRVEASEMFKFQKAIEEFQAALAPVGEAFLKLATPLIEFGTRILDRFNEMSDGAKMFVVGLTATLGVVAPAVLMLVGLIANGIANLLLFGTKVSGVFSKTSGSSNLLTEQLNYMNSEQIESAAVAASLDQVHQTLIQTFNAEAGAVGNLTNAYGRAIAAQRQFMSSGSVAPSSRGGAPKPSTNPFMPPKYNKGILSVPGTGNKDTELALLTPGEAVIPAEQAKKYGAIIESIISDNVPGYNLGKRGANTQRTQKGHIAPNLDTSDPAVIQQLLGQGFSQADIADPGIMFLPDLTIDMPAWINQALREGKGGVDPDIWLKAMGTDALPGALKETLSAAMGEAGPAVDKLADDIQDRIVSRAAQIAKETGSVVSDNIVNQAADQVIGDLESSDNELERKAGKGMRERQKGASATRSKISRDELRRRVESGEVQVTSGGTVKTQDGTVIGRTVGEGKYKDAVTKTIPRERGGFAKPYQSGSRKPLELGEMQQMQQADLEAENSAIIAAAKASGEAHNDALESVVEDPFDVAARKAGRNSPHPNAFPHGAEDAKDYNRGQESVLGPDSDPYRKPGAPPPPPGSPLAPPSPPSSDVTPSKMNRFKTRAKGVAEKGLDIFSRTGPGKQMAQFFADTSGADIVDSKGNVIAVAKSVEELKGAAAKQTEAAAQQNQAADRLDAAGNELIQGANELEDGANDLERAAMKQQRGGGQRGGGGVVPAGSGKSDTNAKRGITAGGAGLSMGLSALTMGASMAPGAIGEQAQKFMPALMALSSLPILIQALQSPLFAVVAAIAAVAGAVFMLNNKMKDAQKEAMELGKALGSGTDAMKELADFAGTVSAGQFMDKVRQERLTGVETAPGKTTFGESFVGDERGQALIEAARTQMAQTGDVNATINSLTSQLATAVMTNVLTKEQASSIASNLGFALNNMEIGLQVRANIAQLTGPNGEDITGGDLVEFAAQANMQNIENIDQQIEMMNRNLAGVVGDELGEQIGVTAASALAGAGGGAAIGAIFAPFTAGLSILIGAGLGAIGGAVAGYFSMRDAAEEAGRLSGAVVATMTNALQQQQELSDAVDAYYIKKIEEAKVQGDITEQLRLQAEYEQKKVEMSEQEMAMREQMRGALQGPGAEAARTGISAAIETRFQDDADAQLLLPGIQATMESLQLSEADTDVINLELATGAITPQALNSLLTFIGEDGASKNALLNIFGKFGGVFADEAGQVMSLIDDQELAADIFVNISNAGNEQEAQEILDFVNEIQRQDAVFDTDIILKYMTENENVAQNLQEIFDRTEMGVVTVDQAYEINPKLRNAEAFNELYFDMLPDVDKEQYVRTISMILEMDEAELIASEDFKKWLGDEGQVHGSFPGRHSFARWQRLYAESMGQKVTKQLSAADTTFEEPEVEEEPSGGGGGGGGPQASDIDDLIKKLRDLRQSQIEVTNGWVESRNALDRLFGEGSDIKVFEGIEQQMRRIGAGEDLIAMIVGMDPEDYERRKHELFQFDNMGNIIGATTALQNMGKALRAIALGDFQSEQERVINGINEQMVAFRKLTAAGLSAAAAYDAIKDAAFASAIAREKDNKVIRETIRLTKQAIELNRAFQAAQSIARRNQETADLSGVVRFIEQNARSLTEAQKSAILNDPELQTLIMNPSVDPNTLRKALSDAAKSQELELRIKKLTFEGLQEIFQDGFSKAMEAFAAKETEITLAFDIKREPFEDAIQEAEEAISDIRNRAGGIDDLEADVERISRQEDEINKKYDDRIKALDEVDKINERINKRKDAQLDVADALSQGDIAAAARAARQASQEAAAAAAKNQRDQIELSREREIARLTGDMGLTREQLEERIKELQLEIFNIEENRLEPAERQVELLNREQALLIESLTVLGRTREEWERIKNEVDLANINSAKFQQAMQDALDVVEDIKTYWDEFEDKEVDLFVNVKQQGSIQDIEDVIQAPPPTPDPGSGGGGAEEEEPDLEALKGQTIQSLEGREQGTFLEGMRGPRAQTSEEFGREYQLSLYRQDLGRKKAELAEIESTPEFFLGPESKQRRDELRGQINGLEKTVYYLQQQVDEDKANQLNNLASFAATGATDLMEASRFIFDNLESGNIAVADVGKVFTDLGVSIPNLFQAFPNILQNLDTEQIASQITTHFQTMAANVGATIRDIPQVFSMMPEELRNTVNQGLLPIWQEHKSALEELDLPASMNLDNITEWWAKLPLDIQEQILPLLSDALVDFGDIAASDLDASIGQWWELFPGVTKDLIEGSIGPALEQEAMTAGLSIEQYITKEFINMSDATRILLEEDLGEAFNSMASNAVAAIALPGSALAAMGPIGEETATTIGNAIRGAMADGQVNVEELMNFIASIPDDQSIEEALGSDSRFAHLVELGAESAAENLSPLTEKVEGIPTEEDIVSAITDPNNTDSLPYLFGLGGTESGDKFSQEAIEKIEEAIGDYTPTEIEIPYRYVAQNSLPEGGDITGNIGGLMGLTGFRRNNGGPIPYMRGGLAKYLAGGVVGGFGNYDNVPAMLTPGEFVIRREAVDKYGRNFFAQLNSTIFDRKPDLRFSRISSPNFDLTPSANYESANSNSARGEIRYNNSYEINVNVKSESNPDEIARTVVQSIKRVDSQRIRGNRL